jgi:hypothetical protein
MDVGRHAPRRIVFAMSERATPPSPQDASTTHQGRPRRRRWLIVVAAIAILVGAGLFVLTRPSTLERLLRPALARAFGGDVVLGEVALDGFTSLRVASIDLRAPGWTGDAGAVLAARDVRIGLGRAALFRGRIALETLDVGDLRLRIAEREDAPGTFNLGALAPEWTGAGTGGGAADLKRLTLDRIELDVGSLARDGSFGRSGARVFRGSLAPTAASTLSNVVFGYRLEEIDGDLRLEGTWTQRAGQEAASTLTAQLGAIALDDRVFDMLPLAMRGAARSFELGGAVQSAVLRWTQGAAPTAEVAVADMALVLPDIDLDDRWSRFRDGRREPREGLPTMRIKEGTIRFDGGRVRFERLVGELASSAADPGLVPVPVELSFDMDLGGDALRDVRWRDPAARDAWFRSLLETAPFTLSVAIRGFDSRNAAPGSTPILEVPTPIAAAFEEFGFTAWRLDVEAEFTRSPPTRNADGTVVAAPVRSRGQCFLSDAAGAYTEFPYPIVGVRGHITFDNVVDDGGAIRDRFTVDYITGTTVSGCVVNIAGNVVAPGPAAAVDINVRAEGLPLDGQLVGCFDGDQRTALALLLHRPSFDALVASGLVPQDDRAEIDAEIRSREAELRGVGSDERRRTEIAAELGRLRRMRETRPFELGGRADIDLELTRALGRGNPMVATGSVTIGRAGLVVGEFPYPFVVTGGTLVVERDMIRLAGDGLRAITLEGGLVRIAGHLAIERQGSGSQQTTKVRPAITVTGAGDQVSELLLAAIPLPSGSSTEGWPGPTRAPSAKLLDAANLTGVLDFHCTIADRPEAPGVPVIALDIEVSDGRIDAEELGDLDLAFPSGLRLRELEASLRLIDGRFLIRSLTAEPADGVGSIGVRGSYNPDGSKALGMEARGVRFAPWLVEALPANARALARRWWRHLRPEGTFDATLAIDEPAGGPMSIDLVARPRELALEPIDEDGVARRRIELRGEAGEFALRATGPEGTAEAKGLVLALLGPSPTEGGEPPTEDGTLTLDGVMQFAADGVRELDATVRAADLELGTPLIPALIDEAGARGFSDAYDLRSPRGRLDAVVKVRSIGGARPDWSLDATPKTLELDMPSTVSGPGGLPTVVRPSLAFDADSRIRATPSSVEFSSINARTPSGSFSLDGSIDLGRTPRAATLRFGLDAVELAPDIAAFLPPPIAQARSAIDLAAGAFSLKDASIHVQWPDGATLDAPSVYALDTSFVARDASFQAGVDVGSCSGSGTLAFRWSNDPTGSASTAGGEPRPRIDLDVVLRADSLRLFDRLVTDATATLVLDDQGGRLSAPAFDGGVAGGRLAGDAHFDIASRRYTADVRVSGAQLGPLMHPRAESPPTSGTIDGRLSLEGIAGDLASRRGRGRISIRDGRMANAPITMRLLQLSQLALPLSSTLRSADIAFFLEGPMATFEQFTLATEGIELQGAGDLDTRDFSIDLVFTTRGRLGLVSDVVAALNNQLWEIIIDGTLDQPNASLRPLPALTRPAPRNRQTNAR